MFMLLVVVVRSVGAVDAVSWRDDVSSSVVHPNKLQSFSLSSVKGEVVK